MWYVNYISRKLGTKKRKHHLKGLSNHKILGQPSTVSDSAGLGGGLRICICNGFPAKGEVDTDLNAEPGRFKCIFLLVWLLLGAENRGEFSGAWGLFGIWSWEVLGGECRVRKWREGRRWRLHKSPLGVACGKIPLREVMGDSEHASRLSWLGGWGGGSLWAGGWGLFLPAQLPVGQELGL